MNSDVMKVVYAALFGATGPIAAWLLTKGVPADQVSPLLNALQVILSAATPLLSTAFLGLMQTVKGKIAGTKSLPDEAKIAVAASVPAVTQIVVSDQAVDGAAKAAADPAQPKVMTETVAKGT